MKFLMGDVWPARTFVFLFERKSVFHLFVMLCISEFIILFVSKWGGMALSTLLMSSVTSNVRFVGLFVFYSVKTFLCGICKESISGI